MSINHNKSLLKNYFAIVLGTVLAKYITYSFSFEIPIIALSIVDTKSRFTVTKFLKENSWLPASAALGVLVGEFFKEKYFLFAVFSFGIFFTCFYHVKQNPKAILNSILGYSFTSVYSTYANQNLERLVYDIVIVTILGGVLGIVILFVFKNKNRDILKEKFSEHKIAPENVSVKKVFLLSSIIFLTWLLYIIFNIKDTFFAFATLALMYGNLDIKKIHKLTPLIIFIHISGCLIAIFYSFFVNGLSNSIVLFSLSLSIIFFPMVYFKYYGSSALIKSFSNSLIPATILPICLYLNPAGDITQKAGARALQITVFLLVSFVMTKILLTLDSESD
ncbi:MAG: hypothetical protein ACRC0R_07025 [Cetobacterium sp.]